MELLRLLPHALQSGLLPMEMWDHNFTKHFVLFFFIILASSSPATSQTRYGALLNCLSKNVDTSAGDATILFSPDAASYTSTLNSYVRNLRYNESTTRKPEFIITAHRESDVQTAVKCTKNAGLLLKTRSGGHDYEGVSYVADVPFVLLDMFNLRSMSVDIASETASIQAGATLGELYYEIAKHSRVHGFPAGVCPTVAVGGHITGGGYGTLLRKYGLSVDNLVDARIVDISGRILNRKSMGEDLFWAIQGGGGSSFGVILSYKIKLVSVPATVTYFRVERWGEDNVTNLVGGWQRVAPTTDEDLFMRLLLQPATPRNDGKKNKKTEKTIRGTVIALFLGPSDRLLSILNGEFSELGLNRNDCLEMDWITSVLYWNSMNSSSSLTTLLDRFGSAGFLKRKSDYLTKPIPTKSMPGLFRKIVELDKPGLVFNPYGGVMNKILKTATAFPHRSGNLAKVQYSATWNNAAENGKNLAKMDELYEFMTPLVSRDPRRAFLNYRDLSIGRSKNGTASYREAMTYGRKYFDANFERLVTVKTAVDPTNFFRNEQSIPICGAAERCHGDGD